MFEYRTIVWFTDSMIFMFAKPGKKFLWGTVCFKWTICVSSHSYLNLTSNVFDRGKEIDVLRSGNYVYELIFQGGYPLDSLFQHSNVSQIVKIGETRAAFQLFNKISRQVSVYWANVILHVTKESRPRNAGSLSIQECLYCGLDFAGRTFDRGRVLGINYGLVHMISGSSVVDTATLFVNLSYEMHQSNCISWSIKW